MPASQQDMKTLLDIVTRVDEMQVRQLNAALKARRATATAMAIVNFQVGDKVKWNGKFGPATGVVQKKKQKYLLVAQDGPQNYHWNIPATMLEKA